MAAQEDGYFDTVLQFCLCLYCRPMTRDTLPLSVWHLHPCISKALTHVERLAGRVRTLSSEEASRNRRIAKYRYLEIFVISTIVFGCLRVRQRLGLTCDFAIATRIND